MIAGGKFCRLGLGLGLGLAGAVGCGRIGFDASTGSTGDGSTPAVDASATSVTPPTVGLFAHWPLDEGAGTMVFDASGNGRDGTLVGGPTWTDGRVGAFALRFDGIDDYVNFGNTLAMTSSFSVSAWIFAEAVITVDNRIVTHGASPGDRNWILRDEFGRTAIEISTDGTSAVARYEQGDTPLASWVHYVGVYDAQAQTLDIYRDGALSNGLLSGPVPASIPAPAGTESWLGSNGPGGSRLMNGIIDEVRVYSRALSPAEADALYRAR